MNAVEVVAVTMASFCVGIFVVAGLVDLYRDYKEKTSDKDNRS